MPNVVGMAQWALMYPRLAVLCRDLTLTSADIAEILNHEFRPAVPLTRHAVIGKVYRTRLRKRWEIRSKPKTAVLLPETYLPPPVTEAGLSILDLTGASCRWPIAGWGSAMRYCGVPEAALPGHPYCNKHAGMAYNGKRQSA